MYDVFVTGHSAPMIPSVRMRAFEVIGGGMSSRHVELRTRDVLYAFIQSVRRTNNQDLQFR